MAHELSPAADRPDRPTTSKEAQERFAAFLEGLRAQAPRSGLGAATGHFVDHITNVAASYGPHLFVCFDDPRVPATTNMLEGFFGRAKRPLRRACGAASTSNSIAQNLGTDYLVAFAFVDHHERLAASLNEDAAETFLRERARVAAAEADSTHRRSLVRRFDSHVTRLRERLNLDEP